MAPNRIIETDGLPAPVCERVCSWCQKSLGVVACLPEQARRISHGICDACLALVRGECLESGGLMRCGLAPADAGSPAPLPSPATGTNDAAAAQVPPGTIARVNGATAPGAYEPAALEHLSGGPAASSDLEIKPLKMEAPGRAFVEFIDFWIKSVSTGRRLD